MTSDGDLYQADAQQVLTELGKRSAHKAALLSMLISMEGDYTRDGWDQPPAMIALKGFKMDETQYAVVGKTIGTLPESVTSLGGDGIAAFIRLAAGDIARMVDPEELQAIVAMSLMSEGWAISAKPGEEEAALQASRAHTIHIRPDRIEVRLFTCVDRDGVLYAVQRERDGALTASVTISRDEYRGQIPEAMRKLMWAVNNASS